MIAASGREQFVLGVKQVEQGALADVELVAIGVARLFHEADLNVEEGHLLAQALDVVVGDRKRLPRVAAGLVAQIDGEVAALNVLPFAGAVRTAVEQVVGQHHLGHVVDAVADDVQRVLGVVGARPEIEAGRVGGAAHGDVVFGGLDILLGGEHARVLLEHPFERRLLAGRHRPADQRWREGDVRGSLVDDALVTRGDVMQVGRLGGQVDFGQRQTAGCLLEIDAAAATGLGAAQQLFERRAVLNVVVFGKIDEEAVAQHVKVGAACFEGDVVDRLEEFVVAHQLGLVQSFDFVARGKAVEQHLVEADQLAGAIVVTLVVGFRAAEHRLLDIFAPGPGHHIDARQVAAEGDADLLDRSLEVVVLGIHFGAVHDRLLSDLTQPREARVAFRRSGLGRQPDQRKGGEQQGGEDSSVSH